MLINRKMHYRWVDCFPLNHQYDLQDFRRVQLLRLWFRESYLYSNETYPCARIYRASVVYLLLHPQKHSIKQYLLMNRKMVLHKCQTDRVLKYGHRKVCRLFLYLHLYVNQLIVFSNLEMSLLASFQWKEGKGLAWLWVSFTLPTAMGLVTLGLAWEVLHFTFALQLYHIS